MTSSLAQFTVLQDLPIFSGNPREGEPSFKNEINVRDFLRATENYFLNNNITDNQKKLSILFSLIDKRRGDAMRLVASFAGKTPKFEKVRQIFLDMYPSVDVTNFRNAAIALMSTNLTERYIFCSMTALEAQSQAVTEAYLNNHTLTGGLFGVDSVVGVPANPSVADSSEGGTSTTPRGGTNLQQILHNYTMHLFVSSQLEPKIYKKVDHVGPRDESTEFMAATVKATETVKLSRPTHTATRTKTSRDEPIWIHAEGNKQQPQNQVAVRQVRGAPQQQKPGQSQSNRTEIRCYNCNGLGHTRKECKVCSYCKIYGHTSKDCKKRMADNKGKDCNYCGIKDSHVEKDCRKKKADQAKAGQLRMVQSEEADKGQNGGSEPYNELYDPNFYDENQENLRVGAQQY